MFFQIQGVCLAYLRSPTVSEVTLPPTIFCASRIKTLLLGFVVKISAACKPDMPAPTTI